MKTKNQIIKNRKRKIPSSVSLTTCLSHLIYNSKRYLNLSTYVLGKYCGPTENRTRDFCVIDKCFTIKLMAHNNCNNKYYINFRSKNNK